MQSWPFVLENLCFELFCCIICAVVCPREQRQCFPGSRSTVCIYQHGHLTGQRCRTFCIDAGGISAVYELLIKASAGDVATTKIISLLITVVRKRKLRGVSREIMKEFLNIDWRNTVRAHVYACAFLSVELRIHEFYLMIFFLWLPFFPVFQWQFEYKYSSIWVPVFKFFCRKTMKST